MEEFVDYYETLEVSPNAQPETIHRVYRLLAQLYHPDNQESGNSSQFKQLLEAYRVLSDPERRASYDALHGDARSRRWQIFDQTTAIQGIAAEQRKRIGILSLLFAKRAQSPNWPTLNVVEMEQLLGCPREHLEMSLWFLKETARISRTDNGRYALTAKGLETLEENMDSIPEPRYLPAPEMVHSATA